MESLNYSATNDRCRISNLVRFSARQHELDPLNLFHLDGWKINHCLTALGFLSEIKANHEF